MKNETPSTKRTIQSLIVNNLKSALCWWLMAALRQIMIPIEIRNKNVYFWRNGYLKVLRKEMKDFKERYKVKRMNSITYPTTTSSNFAFGQLKFRIVDNKLRPIFRRKTADRLKEFMHWKKVNSALSWCLQKTGIVRPSIIDSCKEISKFLTRNSDFPQLFGYTADVNKCFSTVKHRTAICIVERLLENRCQIYTVCGKGVDDRGYKKLFFCSRDSEDDARIALKLKMESKKVKQHNVVFSDQISSKWLLEEIRSTVSSYYYKRGKTTWKITKGVPQGHPLSSHLSFMYLNDFEEENWGKERYDARIIYCRYEDDYVFITTEKKLFKRIAKPLLTGENGHSLKANHEKCKKSGADHKIIWCGVKMDLKNAQFFRRKRCSDGFFRSFLINS